MKDKFNLEDLKSGYVVKLRDGSLRMVIRVGRFTKVLVSRNLEEGSWEYLSSYDSNLRKKMSSDPNLLPSYMQIRRKSHDIMEVYGLVQGSEFYDSALMVSTEHRDLLWSRKKVVKMTLNEVCEKLGYDIELIPEGGNIDE